MVAKAGIPNARAYMETSFPGGLALSEAYVDASALQQVSFQQQLCQLWKGPLLRR